MKRLKYFTLAALVAFAACGEDEAPPVVETITGTISGVVTIEGVGQSGITVALSSGATATTDGSGAYSFANVEAGAYTVTISGFASDATFSSTSKAASIATDGQVVQVNFDGTYVRTSAILGAVSAGGSGLAGVTVSIGSSSTQTDANGQYSFSGLRAGTYTVTISGFNASTYIFASTSQTVTLGVGESEVVSFSGQLATTAQIIGSMYLDELPKNDAFDAAEDAYMLAGVPIELEIAPGNTVTVNTDENGAYAFTGLAAGTYKVSIDHSDIPAEVALGTPASDIVTVTVGTTGEVNFGFDIIQQTLMVHAFLGRDGENTQEFPIEGVEVCLFGDRNLTVPLPDAADNCQDTDENGAIAFVYDRADDPGATNVTDNIVFATFGGVVPADHMFDPEANEFQAGVMEISYGPSDIHAMAPDEIDVLATAIEVSFLGVESDGDPLDGDWDGELWRDDAVVHVVHPDADPNNDIPDGTFSLDNNIVWDANNYPVTLAVRLPTSNGGDDGHGWAQVPTGDEGTVPAEDDDGTAIDETTIITFEWDGTGVPVGTVVSMGTETVTYEDSDVLVKVHHELDDIDGFTSDGEGDDDSTDAVFGNVVVELCPLPSTGTIDYDLCFGVNEYDGNGDEPAAVGENMWEFVDVPVEYCFDNDCTDVTNTYHMRATAVANAPIKVLEAAEVPITLDGSDQITFDYVLDGGDDGDESTFAIKAINNTIEGLVTSTNLGSNVLWTPVEGAIVTVVPTIDNIQGSEPDPENDFFMTDTTDANGEYSITGLADGPYTITVDADGMDWVFEKTLGTDADGTDPGATTPLESGNEDNTDAASGDRDLDGPTFTATANFEAVYTAGMITGQVANDRDGDGTTIDPNEALAGAQFGLYTDFGGDDEAMVASATTDASGIYEFAGVHEGEYTVVWMAATPDATVEVLQALNDDEFDVTVTADDPEFGDLTDNLPAWDYDLTEGVNVTGTSFTDYAFLYTNTTVRGTVTDGTDPVAGMTVSLRRCDDSQGATSPAQAVNAGVVECSSYLGTTQNATTNSSGVAEFTGLTEGVYQVTPQPGTVGNFTTSNPAARLYLTVGAGDVESASFTVS